MTRRSAGKTGARAGAKKSARKIALKTIKGTAKKSPRDKGALHNRARRKKLRGAELKKQASTVLERLLREYPDAHCELDYRSPYELIVATILSAQCTDKRVNMVTPALFARYPNPGALANADPAALEEMIRSTGFFRNKTKSLLGMAAAVEERHGGQIPNAMETLTTLPGVGRKTANVVLGNAFGINEGITVDTHVQRLSQRLGLTTETDPVEIEQDLMPLIPREQWTMFSHLLIFHGRRVCDARAPLCEKCVLADICPSSRIR